MEHLHKGAKWLFRINSYIGLAVVGIIIFLYLGIFLVKIFGAWAILIGILLWILFVIGIAEIYAQLAYKYWKYEFAPTNLKIERGIIWKRYSNIPYERVQNVDIHRGILARIFGFSSVNIQTAGYSGYYGGRRGTATSEGYIPAVSIKSAEKIREFLIKKITKRDNRQGL